MYQNFTVTQATSYTTSSSGGASTNNVTSGGTTTVSSYGYSNGDTYSSSSSEGGTASGGGISIVLSAAYALALSLSGYAGRMNSNSLSFSTSSSPQVVSASSVISTTYTTFSAAYGESGSMSSGDTIPNSAVRTAHLGEKCRGFVVGVRSRRDMSRDRAGRSCGLQPVAPTRCSASSLSVEPGHSEPVQMQSSW
jgi:hypothetical protein